MDGRKKTGSRPPWTAAGFSRIMPVFKACLFFLSAAAVSFVKTDMSTGAFTGTAVKNMLNCGIYIRKQSVVHCGIKAVDSKQESAGACRCAFERSFYYVL